MHNSLAKLDWRILGSLEDDSRQSMSQIAKKLKTSKEVINYHIKKLVDEKYILRFFTEINLAKLGMQVYKIYFQFQNVSDEKEEEMYHYFTQELKIPWVISCSGSYDMIVSFGAKDINTFNEFLTKIMNKFSEYILHREISTTLYFSTFNRKWINKSTIAKYTTVGGDMNIPQLDSKDYMILANLSNDSRINIIELAKKTKMTSAAVIYRLNAMKEKGIINAYRIGLNYKKFNKEFCKCFIYLKNNTTEKERKFLNYVKQLSETYTIIKCVGSWDIEFEFIVDNFTQFHSIMRDLKNRFDIIRGYESVIISQEYGINYYNFI
ncbi:MAG: Lrp/AsnC family transcriptional regulator [Candidatus Woesearchaeota archaeon]